VVAEDFESVRRLPTWFSSGRVMPDINRIIDFGNRIRADPAAFVGPLLIRNVDVAAVGVPHPAMERALDSILDDAASVRQVRTEMLAVGVKDTDLAVQLPE